MNDASLGGRLFGQHYIPFHRSRLDLHLPAGRVPATLISIPRCEVRIKHVATHRLLRSGGRRFGNRRMTTPHKFCQRAIRSELTCNIVRRQPLRRNRSCSTLARRLHNHTASAAN